MLDVRYQLRQAGRRPGRPPRRCTPGRPRRSCPTSDARRWSSWARSTPTSLPRA